MAKNRKWKAVGGLTLICDVCFVAKEVKIHRARGKDIQAGGGALTSFLAFTRTERTGRERRGRKIELTDWPVGSLYCFPCGFGGLTARGKQTLSAGHSGAGCQFVDGI